jgi:hypothetical protein
LKKQIESKKKDLADAKVKFTPETNCVLDLEGTKYNLNVCTDETLIMLLLKLNMYKMSARDLNMSIPECSGYSIDLWISDIRNKLEVSSVRKELNDLKKMEAKLDKLLSDDKKTELELDEIAAMIQL